MQILSDRDKVFRSISVPKEFEKQVFFGLFSPIVTNIPLFLPQDLGVYPQKSVGEKVLLLLTSPPPPEYALDYYTYVYCFVRALYLPEEKKEGMDALEAVSGELRGDRLAVLDAVNKPTVHRYQCWKYPNFIRKTEPAGYFLGDPDPAGAFIGFRIQLGFMKDPVSDGI